MVIGLNHRTAPLSMRERFWIGENRRYEVLRRLKSAEGIEEVAVLCTRCRTEFLVWANEPTLAATSILQFLSSACELKLSEWQHFYRLIDEAALLIFFESPRASTLYFWESRKSRRRSSPRGSRRATLAPGSILNSALGRTLEVSQKVRSETTSASWVSQFQRLRLNWRGISSARWKTAGCCCSEPTKCANSRCVT